MKRLSYIIILASLFLSGCTQKNDENEAMKISLFYPNSTRTDLVKIQTDFSRQDFDIRNAFELINDEKTNILPKNVKVEKFDINNGIVSIFLTENFNSLSKQDRIVTKGAIVNVLTSVYNIYGVEFYINEIIDESDSIKIYSRRNFLFSDEVENRVKNIDVILYFYDKDNNKLSKSVGKIFYNTYETAEFNLLKELVKGYQIKGKPNLIPILPTNIKIYSAETVDGICKVRINEELSKIEDENMLELAVYSMVNSLSSIPGIEGVQIYTNRGEGITNKGILKFNKILYKNESINIVVLPEK